MWIPVASRQDFVHKSQFKLLQAQGVRLLTFDVRKRAWNTVLCPAIYSVLALVQTNLRVCTWF